MKSPHFTRLMRPKAPLTRLLRLPDNAQYTPLAANSLSVMAGLPSYPLGSAWTLLLSTPHTTLLLSWHHHLPLPHLHPTSNPLRSHILPVPPLFDAETCLERGGERSSLAFYLLVYHLSSFLVMALLSQGLLWRSENQTGLFLVVPKRNIDASDE